METPKVAFPLRLHFLFLLVFLRLPSSERPFGASAIIAFSLSSISCSKDARDAMVVFSAFLRFTTAFLDRNSPGSETWECSCYIPFSLGLSLGLKCSSTDLLTDCENLGPATWKYGLCLLWAAAFVYRFQARRMIYHCGLLFFEWSMRRFPGLNIIDSMRPRGFWQYTLWTM